MPDDLTNAYNSELSPEEEAAFRAWIATMSEKNGRDMTKDMFDYDMRGAFKAGEGQADDGHFTDKFKKPNHPTFSTESIYSGVDGKVGGKWTEEGNDAWTFEPSATNLKQYSPAELQDYWKRAEQPDKVKLKLPETAKVQPTPKRRNETIVGGDPGGATIIGDY